MKIRFLIFTSLLVSLFSCAGAPEPAVQQQKSKPEEKLVSESPSATVKWVPETAVSMYVDGTIDKVTEYSYDKLARPVVEIETDSRDELILQRRYIYDNGNLSTLEISDRTGVISTTTYESDNKGRVIREVTRDSASKVQSELRFNYDGVLLVSTVARDAADNPQLVSEYGYQDGIATSIEYRKIDGTLEARFERVLDGQNIVEERTILSDGTVESAVNLESKGNRKVSGLYYIGDTKTKTVVYDSDENGNVLRETWLNANGRPFEVIERSWVGIQTAVERGVKL